MNEKEKEESNSKSNEVSFDKTALMNFMKKYGYLLLLLIPIILAIGFRVQPLYLPVTDTWAQNSLDTSLKQQISTQIDQQYPNLPAANKERLINDELQKQISADRAGYNKQRQIISKQFKEHFQDETGQTYLLAIDPYTYYRQVQNIVDHGHSGDTLKDGKPWNTHMLAPIGVPARINFHTLFGTYLYKLVNFFDKDTTILNTQFIIPLLIMILSVMPAFFIGRRLAGNIGGLFAGIMIAIHPAILTRTISGFSDTDAYNIFFPLMIVWLTLLLFEAEGIKKKSIYAGITGLTMGIYLFAWNSGWFIIDSILGGIFIYSMYLIIKDKKHFSILKEKKGKNILISTGLFLGGYIIFIGLFKGIEKIPLLLTGPLSKLSIKSASHLTLWPNVYTTVAELNEASLTRILATIGGTLITVLAVIGIIYLILSKKREKVFAGVIICLWFFGTLFMSTKGIRFTLLLAPALALGFGVFIGKFTDYAENKGAKALHINKFLAAGVVILIGLILLGFTPIPSFCNHGMCEAAKGTAYNEVPSFTDAWNNALTKIKLNSEEDAIINSWWDFGHWFKAYGDRPVTFDGGSQNRPQAHWIGHVLLTEDEEEAKGILNMLDCGANTAFDILNKELDKPYNSVKILYEIVVLDKEKAKTILLKYVDELTANEILEKTHCNPPENFFITSGDMIGKAGVWAHFGGWNFERAKIWTDLKKRPQDEAVKFMVDEFNYTEEYAEKLYYETETLREGQEANSWISPWPGYVGQGACSPESGTLLKCQHKIQGGIITFDIDITDMSVKTNTQDKAPPASIVYADVNGFQTKKFKGKTLPYSIGIISDGKNRFKSILMSPELAGSMFTRLFYYGGIGLKYFDHFDSQRSMTGVDIHVWKIDWTGSSVNIPEVPEQEKTNQTIEVVQETEEEIIEVNITEETENVFVVEENKTQEEVNASS